ncbi:MAG: hypothetical protein A4E64_02718 [Syntrophorhabdus sp. PtaU1.Bin058]|nr:MAG: hypothetical protein A4E64_02718 [Syntrophorhabdus sp. PtaU1.Bin058]
MDEMRPDRLEKGIRFGCGSLLGIGLGIIVFFRFFLGHLSWIIPCLVGAVVCGFLAMRYGDNFWRKAIRYWYWW